MANSPAIEPIDAGLGLERHQPVRVTGPRSVGRKVEGIIVKVKESAAIHSATAGLQESFNIPAFRWSNALPGC